MNPIFETIKLENPAMARLHNRVNQMSAFLRIGAAVIGLGIAFSDSSGESIRAQNMPLYNNETGEWMASLDLYESRAWPWSDFYLKIILCYFMVDGSICLQRAGSAEWNKFFGKKICRREISFGKKFLSSSTILVDNMALCSYVELFERDNEVSEEYPLLNENDEIPKGHYVYAHESYYDVEGNLALMSALQNNSELKPNTVYLELSNGNLLYRVHGIEGVQEIKPDDEDLGEFSIPEEIILENTVFKEGLMRITSKRGHTPTVFKCEVNVLYVGDNGERISICLSDIENSSTILSKLKWDAASKRLAHKNIENPFNEGDLYDLIRTYDESMGLTNTTDDEASYFVSLQFFSFLIKVGALLLWKNIDNLLQQPPELKSNVWDNYTQGLKTFSISNASLDDISNGSCLLQYDTCYLVENSLLLMLLVLGARELGSRDGYYMFYKKPARLYFLYLYCFAGIFSLAIVSGIIQPFFSRAKDDQERSELALISTGYESLYLLVENINSLINFLCCSTPIFLGKACLVVFELFLIAKLSSIRSVEMSSNVNLLRILLTVVTFSHISSDLVDMRLLLSRSRGYCFFKKNRIEPNNEGGVRLEQLRKHELEDSTESDATICVKKDMDFHQNNQLETVFMHV